MSQAAEKRGGMPAMQKDAAFDWEDPLDLEGELTEEERMVRDTARGYAQDKLLPRVIEAYREENFDRSLLPEMGALGLLGPDHSGRIWRRRPRLCRLWADRARDRARRFRLPLGDVGAVLAGDASDLCLWHRGAAQEISAEARERRDGRLLRPDRARSRLRSRLDGDARREGRRRLQAHRRQDVDHQFADRRRRGGLGEARRRDPRLHRRARHQGFLDAEDRRQAVAARLGHRRDRARRRGGAGGESAAEREGPRRPVRLPQQCALRHRLGRDGRGGILLASRRGNMCSTASSSAGRSPPIS